MYYRLKIKDDRTGHEGYYLPKVEIKDCIVKIDGRNFFDQPINDDIKTWKYFKNCYF